MSAKRALIVDDSRSARAFLTRVLERYDLEVDSAASAAEAIDYLIRQRPDVIFLDHLMPGMDGFEALSAIKNDPRTATIPVMMYTSQEGELYLSQARALGAMGVLPKQTRPADVSRALEQLRLLGDQPRPESEIATVRVPSLREADVAPPAEPAPTPAPVPMPGPMPAGLTPELREQLDRMLREHGVELRRFVAQSLAQHTGQIIREVRTLMEEGAPESAQALDNEPTVRLRQPGLSGGATLWLTAAAAAIALFAGVLWYYSSGEEAARTETGASPAGVVRAAPRTGLHLPGTRRGAAAAARGTTLMVESVPYGEPPLGGARIDAVQNVFARLTEAGFRGTVEIRTIPGRYCLQGSGDTVMLPPPELSFARCDQFGNPVDAGGVAGRESVDFANMLSAVHMHGRGAFEVQLSTGSADEVVVPYPLPAATRTAGEWNRAAAANNRVEIRTHPLPPP